MTDLRLRRGICVIAATALAADLTCAAATLFSAWGLGDGYLAWFLVPITAIIASLVYRVSRLSPAQRRRVLARCSTRDLMPAHACQAVVCWWVVAFVLALLAFGQGNHVGSTPIPGGRYTLSSHGTNVVVDAHAYRAAHHDTQRFLLMWLSLPLSLGIALSWPGRDAAWPLTEGERARKRVLVRT